MPKFTNPPVLTADEVFSSNATQQHNLGAYATTRDGRGFRYCQAGASALVVGNVIQSAAQVANHLNNAVTATGIGATQVAVTPGATAGAANLYAGGLMVVRTTPGLGYSYSISHHAAIASATEFTLNLMKDSAIEIALTTSSKVDLVLNPYKNVIQTPVTTLTGAVVGVAVYPIVATEFGWLQVSGYGGVLIDGTPAVGQLVGSPGAAAGAAKIFAGTIAIVGTVMHTGVDTRVMGCMININ